MKQIKDFHPNERFLSISIFKFPLGNCGGITDKMADEKESIWIPCDSGTRKFSEFENKDVIFIPEHRGGEYWALTPLMQPTGLVGPMSGGNLAYSSDSRCKRVYHIHDRFETQSTYDRFSN